MRAIETQSAATRLTSEDRERLSEAADTLVLARASDTDARAALAAARAVVLRIRRDKVEPWIEQLAGDLEDAGPVPINRFTVSPHAQGRPMKHAEGPAWR